MWALEYSDSFANGQIDGYFDVVPEAFWKIFKFYVALYAFEHLTYSSDTPEDIKSHIFNAESFGGHIEPLLPAAHRVKIAQSRLFPPRHPPDICATRFFDREDPDKKFMMEQIQRCPDPEAALLFPPRQLIPRKYIMVIFTAMDHVVPLSQHPDSRADQAGSIWKEGHRRYQHSAGCAAADLIV